MRRRDVTDTADPQGQYPLPIAQEPPQHAADEGRRPGVGRSWLIGALLFVCVLSGYLLSFNVDQPSHNGDWFLRYQVTCAIVEHNTFAITPFQNDARTGPGVGGKIYTQYTLGQTTAMIPFYLLGRRLAGLAHTNCAATVAPPIVLLTCKALNFVLGAMLAVLFYATARLLAYSRRISLALTALFAFGSSLWPDVLSTEEHTMESLFLLAAAYAALRYTRRAKGEGRKAEGGGQREQPPGSAGFQPADGRAHGLRHRLRAPLSGHAVLQSAGLVDLDRQQGLWLVAMGLAAGLVFVTRVAGVIAIPIFALYLVALHLVESRKSKVAGRGAEGLSARAAMPRYRPVAAVRHQVSDYRLSTIDYRPLARDLALYGLGVLPGVVVNIVYDTLRFGKPWQTGPYPDHSFGFPPWLGLPDLLVSPGKGLIWYTPALLLLLLAARPFWRRCSRPALLFGLICGVYLLFYANVNYWHGDPAWGPRYLYALLPYLILPLGEVCARWRGYRLPLRGLLVAVLAASFLVQVSAVSVSYWRYFRYAFAYHVDQIDHYSWGWNMNYFWSPAQSPILFMLKSVGDIARAYADHAPLTRKDIITHLGSGNESCIFPVYHHAAICLTDIDALYDRANLNTFAFWWMHTYPWWPLPVVVWLALALLALFLASGGLLLWRVRVDDRPTSLDVPADARSRAIPFPPGDPRMARMALAIAALAALFIWAGIAGVSAARAPQHAAPLVRRTAMGRLIVDGDLAYRVMGLTRLPALPDNRYPAGHGREYAVVRVWLHNLQPHRGQSVHALNFALTDSSGDTMYPRVSHWTPLSSQIAPADRALATLFHVQPVWDPIPPHGSVQTILAYVIPTSARHLTLLGPGVALTPLGKV